MNRVEELERAVADLEEALGNIRACIGLLAKMSADAEIAHAQRRDAVALATRFAEGDLGRMREVEGLVKRNRRDPPPETGGGTRPRFKSPVLRQPQETAMPRRSSAALSVVNVDGSPSKLVPPAYLPEREREIFRRLVGSSDPRHFVVADEPLLCRYAEAVAMAEEAARHLREEGHVVGGRTNPWLVVQEKAVRAIVPLATKLRLAPQSRLDKTVTGARAKAPLASPYDMIDGD